MPWTTNYDPESGLVITVYEGKINANDFRAEEELSIKLAIENDSNRFFVDLLHYKGSLSPISLFEAPTRYEKELKRPIFIAILEPNSQNAREEAKFYETVCNNRGWYVTLFSEKEDAIKWLEEIKSA